jgi:mannose-6-phosphate isomerase-like protein (cupin superfamily)
MKKLKLPKIDLKNIISLPRIKSGASCRGTDMMPEDMGNKPYAFNVCDAAYKNNDYRRTLWTGKSLQLTVMAIPLGEDTGVEMHDGFDQMIRVEEGSAVVEMGRMPGAMSYKEKLSPCSAAIIPAGTYHVIKNVGGGVLRLSSVYAPPAHKWGTVDKINPEKEKM